MLEDRGFSRTTQSSFLSGIEIQCSYQVLPTRAAVSSEVNSAYIPSLPTKVCVGERERERERAYPGLCVF